MPRSYDPIQSAARLVAETLGRESRITRFLRPFYEQVLSGLHGHSGVPWLINGQTYRIDPRYRALLGENWEPETAAFLSARVKSGDLLLDVGANVGMYVMQFCHWSRPNGRVVAFEPNPAACAALRSHIALNGISARADVVEAAVSSNEGFADLHFEGVSGMSRLDIPNPLIQPISQSRRVKTLTLDGFCSASGTRPDWILIDVEGFELHVLKGAATLLSGSRAPNVLVEMHPSLWDSAGTTFDDWVSFFEKSRLTPTSLCEGQDPMRHHGMVLLSPNAA